jgi:hypothetical protein
MYVRTYVHTYVRTYVRRYVVTHVQDWYDEKPDWTYGSGTYDSSQRAAGKMCGQYTPYHLLRIPPVGLRVYLFLILWARARLYFLFVGVLSWPHF